MKLLLSFAIMILVSTVTLAQERVITKAEFDAVYIVTLPKFTILNERAHRRLETYEAREPKLTYELSYSREILSQGEYRYVYKERVDGQPQRLPREIISNGKNTFARDIGGKGVWAIYINPERKMKFYGPHVPDPDPHAVRNHEFPKRFDTSVRENEFKFLGTVTYKGKPARRYSKLEKIVGVEKASGARMETEATVNYWFDEEGIMLRSESVSNGRIGEDIYFLRTSRELEFDPSITVIAPFTNPNLGNAVVR